MRRFEENGGGPHVTDWLTRPRPVGESPWVFPHPSTWPDQDVIAVGADLEPATLVSAYRHGAFPMRIAGTRRIGWWSPDPRGILPLDGLRITKSMRQSAKHFEIRVDTKFEDVVRGCADPSRDGGWISADFVRAYVRLHELGWAHSVEVFDREGALAGGLYGVRIGGFFAGESMFHRQRDASKVALMALVDLMREARMTLLDVQWATDHLTSLGVVEISREDYLARLAEALNPEPRT